MKFRTLAELGDVFLFTAFGVGVFAAVAGTLASAPVAPASAPPDVETLVLSTVPVDISMFTTIPEALAAAEPEPEVGQADEAEVPEVPVLPRPAARPEVDTVVSDVAAPAVVPEPSTTKKKVAPRGRRCTELPDPLIRATGTDSWTVRPGVVQRYTRDWSNLDELGWSSPHDGADGRGDGMQIGGIRCGSDVYDAGFRSGDVIHRVNGKAVKNIPQALMVYAAIRGADVFRVEITRHGEARTLTYRLR